LTTGRWSPPFQRAIAPEALSTSQRAPRGDRVYSSRAIILLSSSVLDSPLVGARAD
jgi:hypothetical protein